MNYINKSQFKKSTGLSYIGSVNSSSKIVKGLKENYHTFIVYLAPSTLSGYNVCAMADQCKDLCLDQSGRAKMDKRNVIRDSRIKKTKLFYEDRQYFMQQLVNEITTAKAKAQSEGANFAVRLNGTSDLSPTIFKLNGTNILQLFPDVQFYDYTKVPGRLAVAEKYDNYHLTFSFDGVNHAATNAALLKGFNVAKVYADHLPKQDQGIKVIDGDLTDLRFKDQSGNTGYFVGLKFKLIKRLQGLTASQKLSIYQESNFIETSHINA